MLKKLVPVKYDYQERDLYEVALDILNEFYEEIDESVIKSYLESNEYEYSQEDIPKLAEEIERVYKEDEQEALDNLDYCFRDRKHIIEQLDNVPWDIDESFYRITSKDVLEAILRNASR